MGLAALSLEGTPEFPYPGRIPDDDVSAGLVLPSAAVAMLGRGGGIATLIMVVSHSRNPMASLQFESSSVDMVIVHGRDLDL